MDKGHEMCLAKTSVGCTVMSLGGYYAKVRCYDPSLCSCREKKDTEVQHLEGSKDAETHALRPIVEENERLRREINEMKEKYRRMKEFAEKNDLQIRERNVPMGANSEATASNTSSSRMKILKGKDKRVVGL